MIAMVQVIDELIEAADYFVRGLAGWRYLFSPVYRRQVRERWRMQSRLETGFEMIGYPLGIVFTVVAVFFLLKLAMATGTV